MAAVTSAVIAGVGGLVAIGQGIDSKMKAKDAQKESQQALAKAKKEFDVNRQEGIQVPLDSYEQAIRETTAQQQQALTALTESDSRSLAAGVGKLQAAVGTQTETNRQAMGDAILARDQAIAKDQTRIDQGLASMSIQEAEGAAAAAADLNKLGGQQLTSGAVAVGQAGLSLYQKSDLYKKKQETPPKVGSELDSSMFKPGATNPFFQGQDFSKQFAPVNVPGFADFTNKYKQTF